MKKSTVVTTVVAVLAVLAVGVALYFSLTKPLVKEPDPGYTLCDEELESVAGKVNATLHYTGFGKVFYTLSPTKYYSLSGKQLKEVTPATRVKVSVALQTDTVKLSVPLITLGGKTFGVSQWEGEGKVYDYAFAYVTDLPSGTPYAAKYLLCLDTERSDKPLADRLFSENFAVTSTGSVLGYITNERNRMVQEDGKLRTDQNVITLGTLSATRGGKVPVFSGLHYNLTTVDKLWDLRQVSGNSTVDVKRKLSSAWCKGAKDGTLVVKQGKDNFSVLKLKGSKASTVCTYPGNLALNYERAGDYALSCSPPHSLYKLGREQPLYTFSNGDIEKAFSYSACGDWLVVASKMPVSDGKAFYGITLVNTKENTRADLLGVSLFDRDSSRFTVLKDGTVVFTKGDSTYWLSAREVQELGNVTD